MPKRKSIEDDLAKLLKKVKKLEQKVKDKSDCESKDNRVQNDEISVEVMDIQGQSASSIPVLGPDDWLPEGCGPENDVDHNITSLCLAEEAGPSLLPPTQSFAKVDELLAPEQEVIGTHEGPSTSGETEANAPLDDDLLEILGDDPSVKAQYGKDIRAELASRLQHIVAEGLDKETRKSLSNKYPLPGNCISLGAPAINSEIKAAIPVHIAKRDKGIETKQKQMACAISCLSEIITTHLNSQVKNNEMLQKLLDATRLLCDLQHGDSITRKNFILFGLKKEMKEHLSNTKIDTYLFGEDLPDTLKSAKIVTKTSAELKLDFDTRTVQNRPLKPLPTKPLNRRAPPVRRPPGPAASARSYAPAAAWPRAAAPPPPPPPPPRPPRGHSYNMSYRQPPLAPQAQRRRY